jgi:chorismate dehydratase
VRLGRIAWVNCFPVYGAIDRGVVPCGAELVSGTAAELNDLLAAGTLDVSVISAVEYARDAARYHLLPDLAIAANGPVHSVMLFSTVPPEQLDARTVLRTASSRTSVLLLELLCRHVWKVTPRFAQVRAEASDLAALAGIPHEAVLVIGDAALMLTAQGTYPHVVDLSAAWKAWTGLPFVFAVWAARREADEQAVRGIHRSLLASRAWGLEHLDELAQDASDRTGTPVALTRDYHGTLDYRLGGAELEGLSTFFRRLAQDGLAPGGALSFISAA